MAYTFSAAKAPAIQVVNRFPIFGLLGLIFVIAKITGYISWSWWLVTLPFWGPLALSIAFLVVVALVLGVVAAVLFGGAWVIDKFNGR